MKLQDISNGPDWVIWAVFAIFVVLSIVLLSGHGGNLIAGYNTAGKEEKNQYDEKKLCRVVGAGMLVITILILITAVGETFLPAWFVYVCLGIILTDCAVMIILANTICKK